jgi:hypothetical protein
METHVSESRRGQSFLWLEDSLFQIGAHEVDEVFGDLLRGEGMLAGL